MLININPNRTLINTFKHKDSLAIFESEGEYKHKIKKSLIRKISNKGDLLIIQFGGGIKRAFFIPGAGILSFFLNEWLTGKSMQIFN